MDVGYADGYAVGDAAGDTVGFGVGVEVPSFSLVGEAVGYKLG